MITEEQMKKLIAKLAPKAQERANKTGIEIYLVEEIECIYIARSDEHFSQSDIVARFLPEKS